MRSYIKFIKNNMSVSWLVSFILNSFQSVFACIFFGFSLKIFFDNINTEKMYLGIFILAVGTLYMILVVPIAGYFMEKGSFKYKYSLSTLILSKIIDLDFSLFLKNSKSEYMTNLEYDTKNASSLTDWNLVVLFQAILSGILSSIIIIYSSIKMYAISIIGGLILFAISRFIIRHSKKYIDILRDTSKNKTQSIMEYSNNIMYYKIYNKEKYMLDKLNADIKNYYDTYYKYDTIYTKLDFVSSAISEVLLYITILISGVILVQKNEITFGSLMLTLEFLTGIVFIFSSIGGYVSSVYKSASSIKNIEGYLKDSTKEKQSENYNTVDSINKITFEKLSFSYSKDKKIFNNIDLEFRAKNKIKIEGSNGVGKSTLFKILLGLYDNYDGKIYINNIDIKHINKDLLKNRMCYIPQHSFMLKDTLKNNILLGKNISYDKLLNIIKLVGLSGISLEYCILFKGENLSLGERKKIILARALINQADVYIQDELDANLNQSTYIPIENNLLKYLEDKIFIKISHQNYSNDYLFRKIKIGN